MKKEKLYGEGPYDKNVRPFDENNIQSTAEQFVNAVLNKTDDIVEHIVDDLIAFPQCLAGTFNESSMKKAIDAVKQTLAYQKLAEQGAFIEYDTEGANYPLINLTKVSSRMR